MVYTSIDEVDFSVEDLPALPRPGRVLMAAPTYFNVEYVINPHMAGNVGPVNRAEAKQQWERLKSAYEEFGIQPVTIPGVEGLPDLVFCANQSLPYYKPDGTKGVLLSRMHAPQRRDEVPIIEQFFSSMGFEITRLPPGDDSFEGMGDAIWHPGRYLLWGGYGFRTSPSVYEFVTDVLNVPVLAIQLEDPDFYHLDTCFSVLDGRSVLIYPGAFLPEGLDLIRRFFPNVIAAPEDEARRLFACNAHCPDGRHVLIQQGCKVTVEALREAGFVPVELDTGEFLKSGGSVFCMKLMFW